MCSFLAIMIIFIDMGRGELGVVKFGRVDTEGLVRQLAVKPSFVCTGF